MEFLSSFNIAASGLTAQKLRLDIIGENLINAESTRTENGGPYRRKMVIFEAVESGQKNFRSQLVTRLRGYNASSNPGVRVAEIVEDPSELKAVYDPTHPDAGDDGYVMMPNVDTLKETVDAMAASRAYEANITVLNAMKLMAQRALDIGR